MTEHVCKKCQAALNDDNSYRGWLKNHMYICKDCGSKVKRDHRLQMKLEVLKEYGGKCTCCNEEKFEFLTIDHIDGKGAEHRRSVGNSSGGCNFYQWLKKNNYPKDNFQILCFNCNYAKHAYGTCPHQH